MIRAIDSLSSSSRSAARRISAARSSKDVVRHVWKVACATSMAADTSSLRVRVERAQGLAGGGVLGCDGHGRHGAIPSPPPRSRSALLPELVSGQWSWRRHRDMRTESERCGGRSRPARACPRRRPPPRCPRSSSGPGSGPPRTGSPRRRVAASRVTRRTSAPVRSAPRRSAPNMLAPTSERPGEVRVAQRRAREVRRAEVGPAQERPAQVRAHHAGTDEGGADGARSREGRLAQVRAVEARGGQVGAGEVGTDQTEPAEVSTREGHVGGGGPGWPGDRHACTVDPRRDARPSALAYPTRRLREHQDQPAPARTALARALEPGSRPRRSLRCRPRAPAGRVPRQNQAFRSTM